jgi:hypothetical protein
MGPASIPVDLFNPGQVFACLGFLEAAELLLGDAEGGFDWSDTITTRFSLRAGGDGNPFATVLEFLVDVELKALAPPNWSPKKKPGKIAKDEKERRKQEREKAKQDKELSDLVRTEFFPSRAPETMAALPVQICNGHVGEEQKIILTHWADSESGRNDFKLYAGNRSALGIASAMITGTREEPRKGQNIGNLETKGITQLWEDNRAALVEAPFDVLTPMGGSFNFDPRGGWTAIDAGYSPNEHKHAIQASPVVEFLTAWGLEHARPLVDMASREVRYAVWGGSLPPILARAALSGALPAVLLKRFRFELNLSGKNKVVTFAQEEPQA